MTVGSEQALAFTDAFNAQMSVARAEVIVHHIAAAGNAVLTERTDLSYNAEAETVFAIKLMGVLVMDGPKIIEWRAYFDTRSDTRLVGKECDRTCCIRWSLFDANKKQTNIKIY